MTDKKSIIYEDKKLFACLAEFPITKGHTIVFWKKRASDLRLLPRKEYEYLMDKVDEVRNSLLRVLKIKKVYLIYMDELNQVHWHLVPRYNKKGYDVFKHKPARTKDFSLAEKIKSDLAKNRK